MVLSIAICNLDRYFLILSSRWNNTKLKGTQTMHVVNVKYPKKFNDPTISNIFATMKIKMMMVIARILGVLCFIFGNLLFMARIKANQHRQRNY